MEYLPSIILWVAIIAAVVYFVFIKKSQNRKAAQTGEDKARVKKAVGKVLEGAGNHQVAYAHWEEQESYGRTVKTTYYRYAAAFQGETLLVFPLGIDKKTREVQVGQPVLLNPERLGKVTVTTKEKDGAVSRVEAWLGDKEGHKIIQLYVDAENLRKSRWYPMNIEQQEECGAFARFLTALSQRVAAENPGVDALIKAESNQGLGTLGAIVSVIGAVVSIFLPPAGVVVCLIGLLMGIVSKVKGAKGVASLIVSVVCAVVGAAFCWMYFTIMF